MGNAGKRLVQLLFAVAVVLGCSSPHGPSADANTNWLTYCEVTADCKGDGACICGLCTRTCSWDAQCEVAGPSASCVAPAAASEEGACAAIVTAAHEQICLASCASDADCGPHLTCIEHACWAHPSAVVDLRDAGEDAHIPETDRMTVDLSSVDAAVDFDQPVVKPMPSVEIQGDDAASLVGVWQEEEPEAGSFYILEIRLEIVKSPTTGGYSGTITFRCPPNRCLPPVGPPPPATDPEAGYPPGLTPSEQDLLRSNPLPGTPYRLFDPRAANARFSFYFTGLDLWRDWCALQTPYPNRADGRLEYACMPDPEVCQTVYDRAAGPQGSEIQGKSLLCCAGGGVCHCDAESCHANYQGAVASADLVVDADIMKGLFIFAGDNYPLVLHRVQTGQQP